MDGSILSSTSVPAAEVESKIREMFGDNITEVKEPWNSHGDIMSVGIYIYFLGDLTDPTSMCGNDPMMMQIASITLAGRCRTDNLLSYHLIPDENAT